MLSNPQNIGGKSAKDNQKDKEKKEEEGSGEKIKKSLSQRPVGAFDFQGNPVMTGVDYR